jgi:hypothetical protein
MAADTRGRRNRVPSLGYTTHQISATDLIWAFFAAHPKPATPPASVGGIALAPEPGGSALAASDAGGDGNRELLLSTLAAMAVVVGASAWLAQRRARR